jgi:hypothetical protein
VSESQILEKEKPMRSLWDMMRDMMRDAAPRLVSKDFLKIGWEDTLGPPNRGLPLEKSFITDNEWSPMLHEQAKSRLNRNEPMVFFDFERSPEITAEQAEAYGISFVDSPLPEVPEVEPEEKPLEFAPLSSLVGEDGMVRVRILATPKPPPMAFLHYVAGRMIGKTNLNREIADYADSELRVMANVCDNDLCKKLIALNDGKKDLRTLISEAFAAAQGGGRAITIDSIPAPTPRRLKRQQKKAKGYQPPTWVTKRGRGKW